ncbi:MAG: chorismate synthase [Lachnospiraceae bacterium]|nr:chorismate synthase [Lachnospiraceae bacterium]
MAGSVFGNIFKVTTWGESHGKALGVVIDGCPAGLALSEEDIIPYMQRRRPGQSDFSTKRNESDTPEILSGVFEGKTTGTPISIIIKNSDQHSGDYSAIASYYRPGHADFTFDEKFGFRDPRGGGRSSGRETAARVAAGAVAAKFLSELSIKCTAYTLSIGDIKAEKTDFSEITQNALYMPDNEAAAKAGEFITKAKENGDSVGGVIECRIDGVPAGLGEPVFDKMSASLAHAVMSIGAVKGFEIGEGFNAARLSGHENNDAFIIKDGSVSKETNHSGGILGGISDGSQILFRCAVKPTPSISMTQKTVTKDGKETDINITGRHDPVIVPRAACVVECMADLVIADALLMNMSSRMDKVISFYTDR